MKAKVGPSPLCCVVVAGFRLAGIVTLFVAFAAYLAYRGDCAVLRGIAHDIVAGNDAPEDRVLAVNNWVYGRGKFSGNRQRFVFSGMGATPLQVIDGGGDCADRSRLVVALLRELQIPSSVVMCFDPVSGNAVHTVVEAEPRRGEFMVVDPAFDLYFPDSKSNSYYGLLSLRRDPTILESRIQTLISSRGYWTRLNGYHRDSSVYDQASTFNWGKNVVTRSARGVLSLFMGNDVYRIRRPSVLEEPKLAVAAAAVMGGLLMVSLSAVVAHVGANRNRSERSERAKTVRRSSGLRAVLPARRENIKPA